MIETGEMKHTYVYEMMQYLIKGLSSVSMRRKYEDKSNLSALSLGSPPPLCELKIVSWF